MHSFILSCQQILRYVYIFKPTHHIIIGNGIDVELSCYDFDVRVHIFTMLLFAGDVLLNQEAAIFN